MDIAILLRGQSNAALFNASGGGEMVRARVQAMLGFDGVTDRVILTGNEVAERGPLTMLGGSTFLPNAFGAPSWLDATPGGTVPGGMESSLLGVAASSPSVPTAVVWMHNEWDSLVSPSAEYWAGEVRKDAAMVRAALYQDAAQVPYLFAFIPYPGNDDGAQALRRGMESLVNDGGFNAAWASNSGDLDMLSEVVDHGPKVYGGPHLGARDIGVLAERIALSVANEFQGYRKFNPDYAVLPFLPPDSEGPEARTAHWLATDARSLVVQFDEPWLLANAGSYLSGQAWTLRSGTEVQNATGASILDDGRMVVSFDHHQDGAVLHYAYGNTRTAGAGESGVGRSVYGLDGLPIWTPPDGVRASDVPHVALSGRPEAYVFTPLGNGQVQLSHANGAGVLGATREDAVFDFSGGDTAFDASGGLAGVARVYHTVLGRSLDSSSSTARYHQGMAEVAAAAVESPEFAARVGHPDNAGFVRLMYRGGLEREADWEGLHTWTGLLDRGEMSRGQVAASIASSVEARVHWNSEAGDPLVAENIRLYGALLGRAPDNPGNVQAFLAGASARDVANGMAGSPEFAARHGHQDDWTYVASVYQAALGRDVDPDGLRFWMGHIAAGATRGEIGLAIADSPEGMVHTQAATHWGQIDLI